MSRLLLSIAFIFTSIACLFGLDLNAIEVDVQMNPGKYRALLERFEQADTTLTASELATIYFGYSFTPNYDPRETFSEIEEAYEASDYARVEQLCAEALKLNPVSLNLNVLALASAEHQRNKGTSGPNILKYGIRSDLIATAILESGRGTNAASPFHVISSSDMSRILRNVLGIERIIDRSKVGPIDAIKVVFPGSDRHHILYFDNTREMRFFSSHPL